MRTLPLLTLVACFTLTGCSGSKKDQPSTKPAQEEPPPPPPRKTKPDTGDKTSGKVPSESLYFGKPLSFWIPELESPNEDSRLKAADAVAAAGPKAKEAAPVLGKLLVRTNAEGKPERYPIRRAVAKALVELGPEAKPAIPQLTQALKNDREPEIRYLAAQALGKVGPDAKSALPVLTQAVDDSNEHLRRDAITALIAIDPKAQETRPVLVKALHHRDPEVALKAENALAGLGEPAVEDLITVVKGNDPVAAARAAEALGMIGPKAKAAVPVLRAELRNRDERVRIQVSAALVKMEKEAKPATDALLDALSDDNSKVRANATSALKIIGPDPSMIPSLMEVLRNKNNPGKDQAATLMALIGKPAVEPLMSLLKSLDVEVLKPAIHALGEIGPDAKPAVRELVLLYEENKDITEREKSADVANESARALKKIDPAEAAKHGIK